MLSERKNSGAGNGKYSSTGREERFVNKNSYEKFAIVEEGAMIKGHIKVDGEAVVFGTVQGDVCAAGVVFVSGQVQGSIYGNTVILSNAFVGDTIVAEKQITIVGHCWGLFGDYPQLTVTATAGPVRLTADVGGVRLLL